LLIFWAEILDSWSATNTDSRKISNSNYSVIKFGVF
jgi:hypothetical protein